MKKENDSAQIMQARLEQIVQSGVGLYLDGHEVSPEEITDICFVREDITYMPDYITDEKGVLREVRYDRVRTV